MKYLQLDPKKRPRRINKKIQGELLNYVQEEVKNKHFPSRRELEGKFRIRLDSYFKGINELYQKANLKYQLHANQNLKKIKAELLLNLIIKNLDLFNLEYIKSRGVNERGIDILTKKKDLLTGIELKAYNKNEKLKARDIEQVERFLKKESLDRAILITTTDKKDKNLKISRKISLIDYRGLLKFLKKKSKDLKFIREHSINREDTSRQIKRQTILDYVLEKHTQENRKPCAKEISKNLHLEIYSYFEDLWEIYKILKIPPPLKNMNGKNARKPDKECISLWKEEFKKYILKEFEKNKRYASGEEIAQHFGISSVWSITNMTSLYRELNLKPYLKRKKRLHPF